MTSSKKTKYMAAANDENLHNENIERGIEAKTKKNIVPDINELEQSVPIAKKNNTCLFKLKNNIRPIVIAVGLLVLVICIFIFVAVFKRKQEENSFKNKSGSLILDSLSESSEKSPDLYMVNKISHISFDLYF